MKKALVTGGAGFVGSNSALELEKQGYEVTVMDDLFTGEKNNLKGFSGKIIKEDIAVSFSPKEKFAVVFHQAAITDPRFDDDDHLIASNVNGFTNILNYCLKNKAKLVYASSASLYGNGPIPMKEDQPKDLQSAYAKSKLMIDEMAKEHFSKLHIVGLRYFNVFGPREAHKGRPASMIYHLSQQMKSGKRPRIFKMGEQKRDHIYVKDVVRANLLAVDAKQSCVVNVGTGIGTTFNEVVRVLNSALGTHLEPEYFDNPYGKNYQVNTLADMAHAKKMLGFTCEWSFKDGVKDYMRWLYG